MFSFKLIEGGIIRVFYKGKFAGDCQNWFEVEHIQQELLQKLQKPKR